MSQACTILFVLIKFVVGYPGETLMVMPPFEVRTLDSYPYTSQFQESRSSQGRQQILHTNEDHNRLLLSMQRNTENNFIKPLNHQKMIYNKEIGSQLQPASILFGRDSNVSDYRPYSGPYPGSYSQPSSTPYGSAPTYQNPSLPATSPPVLPKLSDFSTLFKPVTTKVSGKVNGLLGLILSLLSGSSSGLQLNGLKDVLINGIIQPLLAAKGGLKALIAKLAIPVIALILINLEVLVTVWWLWEDCSIQKLPSPTHSYSKPVYENNYNSYS